jgi:hypothetical protein
MLAVIFGYQFRIRFIGRKQPRASAGKSPPRRRVDKQDLGTTRLGDGRRDRLLINVLERLFPLTPADQMKAVDQFSVLLNRVDSRGRVAEAQRY